jgi:hypothetical protein
MSAFEYVVAVLALVAIIFIAFALGYIRGHHNGADEISHDAGDPRDGD